MKNVVLACLVGLLAYLGAPQSKGQGFNVIVPAEAKMINDPGVLELQGNYYWFCNASVVQVRGSNKTIIADQNTSLDIIGDNNQIYVTSTQSQIITGDNNQIYTDGGSVTVIGSGNKIFAPPTSAVSLTCNTSTRTDLNGLRLDYSISGRQACSPYLSPIPPTLKVLPTVVPHPARTGSVITLEPAAPTPESAPILVDFHGRSFGEYPAGTRSFPLLLVPVGHYMLRYFYAGQLVVMSVQVAP